MVEIGGYFGIEDFSGKEYHKNAVALNTARNALLYILKEHRKQKALLWLPNYLCHAVRNACAAAGFKNIEFYDIGPDFLPANNVFPHKGDLFYLVNYYGQIDNSTIGKIAEKFEGTDLIVDQTHSFFSMPLENVFTLYSCRKWFGVTDGAYLYTNEISKDCFEEDKSFRRVDHLLGRYEQSASKWYKSYLKEEAFLSKEPIKKMSLLTHNLLGAINYEGVSRKRKENFKFLHSQLNFLNEIDINVPEVPFTYPLFIGKDVRRIRLNLIKENIYVPQLWPEILKSEPQNSVAYQYSEHILPLPIDQRYGREEMQIICNLLL